MTTSRRAVDGDVGARRLGVLCLHTATLPPLGADTWVHAKIIAGLDRATHNVHVAYVPERDGAATPTADALDGVEGITRLHVDLGHERTRDGRLPSTADALDAIAALRSMVRLARHIRRHDIRIIHTSDRPRDALASVVLARLTRRRSVVHLHVLYSSWMGRVLQWSIRNADARIAVSRFVADSLASSGVHGPTHVVLNAIEPERWVPGVGRDEARAEFGIAPTTPTCITVCRLFEEKGVAALIRAFADARSDVPDARLLVVGHDPSGGPYQAHLESIVAEHGLEGAVTFTGRRPDVPRLMAAADVFAMPSFEEPFGLVFAEALAMELPVVALDNGGTREVVVHGQHGLLSAPGDHGALVANLRTALTDPELRRQFGTAGRRHVEAAFDVSRMATDTARTYRLIASG